MAEYIEREAVCYQLAKQATIDGQPRAIRRATKIVAGFPAADVRPVVTCSDCKWWTKQEASLQGRCELLQMYPTGAWFCANGKREES